MEASGMSLKHLRKISWSLHKKDLVHYVKAPYEGLILRMSGLDAIALHSLRSLGIISLFGRRIGVGKESDIYEALTPENERVCLKFYRIGRTSFRDVIRKRAYTLAGSYVSWFIRSINAAEREFTVLKRLYKLGVSVPRPIAQNRHIVVMEYLDGEIVARAKKVLNPDLVLREILKIIKDAYNAGYVNCDLSAYNVFITVQGRVLVIDWPQAVKKSMKNSKLRLRKDIERICEYFEDKFGIKIDYKREYERIIGN